MKALVFDKTLSLQEISKPVVASDEVLIRVCRAGICNTDLEILRGYMPGFRGVLGHEFYGYVEEASDSSLQGKRVTAEINCGCGNCDLCKADLGRHCPNRTVLGIAGRNGAFAEYISVPQRNLVMIPDSLPDTSALLIEPLAAALEILEQVAIRKHHSVLLIGDGKLAQLIALSVHTTGCKLTVLGKHPDKLIHMRKIGIETILKETYSTSPFDIVIEASGSPEAFATGLSSVKPRGTFVLKSTYAEGFSFNPAAVIINEITLIGSRCGRFDSAIEFLLEQKPDLAFMQTSVFSLQNGLAAINATRDKKQLKIVLQISEDR